MDFVFTNLVTDPPLVSKNDRTEVTLVFSFSCKFRKFKSIQDRQFDGTGNCSRVTLTVDCPIETTLVTTFDENIDKVFLIMQIASNALQTKDCSIFVVFYFYL